MTGLDFTRHARSRVQQRAIPAAAVDLVVRFGRVRRHRRADVYSLDRKARETMRRHLGPEAYRRLETRLGIYVVVGDAGSVITVAHRIDRLKNA